MFLRTKVYESGQSCGNKLAKEAFSCWEPEFTTYAKSEIGPAIEIDSSKQGFIFSCMKVDYMP